MSLNRLSQCDPWANFARLQQELNQAFGLASLSSSGPTLKVFEDGSALVLEAVVPGYNLKKSKSPFTMPTSSPSRVNIRT